jgi:hypothetical protein
MSKGACQESIRRRLRQGVVDGAPAGELTTVINVAMAAWAGYAERAAPK